MFKKNITHKNMPDKKQLNKVINPQTIKTIYCLPDSPPYIQKDVVNKINNLYVLKKIEFEYDEFLNKKSQILLLLNLMEEVLEMRDIITYKINRLTRETGLKKMKQEYAE